MRYASASYLVLLVFVPICTEREWPRVVGFIAHRRRGQCVAARGEAQRGACIGYAVACMAPRGTGSGRAQSAIGSRAAPASPATRPLPSGRREPGTPSQWPQRPRAPVPPSGRARRRGKCWNRLRGTVGSGNEAGPQPFATLMQQQSGGGGGGPEAEGRSLSGGI
jgi:hypothetical protein